MKGFYVCYGQLRAVPDSLLLQSVYAITPYLLHPHLHVISDK